MKKGLALLLILLMGLAMAGCTGSLEGFELPPLPELTPTPAPTVQVGTESQTGAQETQPSQEPGKTEGTETAAGKTEDEPSPRILVSIGNTTLYNYDPEEGKELILTFSYDMPRVYAAAYPESTEKINETLATLEEIYYTGDINSEGLSGYSDMLTAAEDNYAYAVQNKDAGLPLEFSSTRTARVTRAGDPVLSLVFSNNVYTGGAHGMYWEEGVSFDMQSGEQLSLDQLSSDFDVFADYLVQYMMDLAEKDEGNYYSDRIAEDFVDPENRAEAFRTMLREGSWYFDNQGLVIFSTLGELGPYAAGIVEFRIPYGDLEGRIEAKWLFPREREGEGSLQVCPLTQLEGGDTEIVDKLTLSQDGVELCLVAEGKIYDVSISSVYYSDGFFEKAQLWYASSMSDCALQLQTTVPEGLPDLMISYSTADGLRHSKLLSQSGENGDFILVDDDIQAVG